MSVGPMGFFGAIPLPPSPQTQGSEADRAAQESSTQSGQKANDTKAENAAGIGATDGDEHGANERDADGRRLFEKQPGKKRSVAPVPDAEPLPAPILPSKDPTGASGSQLDLMG
jgi:hypothetical protein